MSSQSFSCKVLIQKLLLLINDNMPFSHLWEAHHIEDPVKLVVMIRVARLDILLPENFVDLKWVQRRMEENKKHQTSHLQWKIGSLVRSSANIQPIAQMSIA